MWKAWQISDITIKHCRDKIWENELFTRSTEKITFGYVVLWSVIGWLSITNLAQTSHRVSKRNVTMF